MDHSTKAELAKRLRVGLEMTLGLLLAAGLSLGFVCMEALVKVGPEFRLDNYQLGTSSKVGPPGGPSTTSSAY